MTLTPEAHDFLAAHQRAVLVTRRTGDGVQSSPVIYALDDAGRLLVSTVSRSAKARNLARDPRAALTVVSEGWFGPWAHVDGTTEIVRLPEALDLLVEYYRRARGEEHPDWAEYRASMVEQDRVVLRITADRVVLAG